MARVGDVGRVQLGRQRSPEHHNGANMRPYLRVANVFEDRIDTRDVMEMNFEDEEFRTYELKPGDILLNEGQSRELVGRPAMYRGEVPGAAFTNSLVRFQAGPATIPEYALALFRHYLHSGHFMLIAKWTTNIAHLGANRFVELEYPLPPLNEQRRIVAKLDALMAKSRRAKEALDAIPPLLDKLRQSILAAAFRGDLTADWRATHPDVEPADWWESTTAGVESATAGRQPRPKRLWGSGSTQGEAPQRLLPEGWRWVQVSQLGTDDQAVQIGPMSMKSNEFVDDGHIVLNVGCVQWGEIELSKCNHLPPNRARDFSLYTLRGGDLLVTRSGTVGRCAVVPTSLEGALMTFHLLRVRPNPDVCLSEYLQLAFWGCGEVAHQLQRSSMGATRAGINTRLLADLWIPLAPPTEQREICKRANTALGRLRSLVSAAKAVDGDIEVLNAAVLGKAFRGELVPQDPNDEPASVLLERIRSESGVQTKTRGRRARSKTA